MAQIFVFGDSIVYGAWDEEGGWVQRLRKFLDIKNLPNYRISRSLSDTDLVYQLGRSGDASEGLLNRFESETKRRIIKSRETIIIFQIGLNDSLLMGPKKQLRTTPREFPKNIQKLIDKAKKVSSKIIFIGLTPVDESKTNPWISGKSYNNGYVEKYNNIIKSVCEQNGVYFIELFEKLKETDYKKLLEDGLHPNSDGHQKIFEIVRDFLIKNKIV